VARPFFHESVWAGFAGCPRPGAKKQYDELTEQRIMVLLDQPTAEGYSQWNGNSARAWSCRTYLMIKSGVFSERTTFSFSDTKLVISTDPAFGAKAADIVGLYLNPPENALVICVDREAFDPGT